MEAYDMTAMMGAMMNDPEAAAAADELMALSADFGAMMAMVFGVLLIAMLVYGLIWVISAWRIFRKAGEEGWKAIVPFCNSYTLYKIAWKKKMFWAMVWMAVINGCVNGLIGYIPTEFAWIAPLVSAVCSIAILVIEIMLQVKLAKAFGKGGGFAVGLILLPVIFYPILAFGKAKFRRRRKRRKPVQPAEA